MLIYLVLAFKILYRCWMPVCRCFSLFGESTVCPAVAVWSHSQPFLSQRSSCRESPLWSHRGMLVSQFMHVPWWSQSEGVRAIHRHSWRFQQGSTIIRIWNIVLLFAGSSYSEISIIHAVRCTHALIFVFAFLFFIRTSKIAFHGCMWTNHSYLSYVRNSPSCLQPIRKPLRSGNTPS